MTYAGQSYVALDKSTGQRPDSSIGYWALFGTVNTINSLAEAPAALVGVPGHKARGGDKGPQGDTRQPRVVDAFWQTVGRLPGKDIFITTPNGLAKRSDARPSPEQPLQARVIRSPTGEGRCNTHDGEGLTVTRGPIATLDVGWQALRCRTLPIGN